MPLHPIADVCHVIYNLLIHTSFLVGLAESLKRSLCMSRLHILSYILITFNACVQVFCFIIGFEGGLAYQNVINLKCMYKGFKAYVCFTESFMGIYFNSVEDGIHVLNYLLLLQYVILSSIRNLQVGRAKFDRITSF